MGGSKSGQPVTQVSDAGGTTRPAGRPRDAGIDHSVLAATRRQLAASGFAALSVAAVAFEAGTTRPAIYRRWPTKSDLAVAAVANLAEAEA
ncbi:MAG: helix-turn-helix domain-containing protein, partial [Actinomycetes bacterium]